MVEYGLIGRGISHSFSGRFFNDKFQKEGIPAQYLHFDLQHISQLQSILDSHPDLHGLNVTSPYKREVISFLDDLSPEARSMNAVNVIEFMRDSQGGLKGLKGHNTDFGGFNLSLEKLLGSEKPKALILGTGGAASAVEFVFRKAGIDYFIVSRTPGKGKITYEECNKRLSDCRLIVNATPVGMFPHVDECPDLDYSQLTSRHICYDLIYNPEETLFLKNAKSRGVVIKNGLEMLTNQAILAWEIWNNKVENQQ